MTMIYTSHSFVFFVIFMICFHHALTEKWISELVVPSTDTTKTCEEWIAFYDLGDDGSENREKALARNRKVDGLVHLWTVSYVSYLASFILQEKPYGPHIFCDLHLNPNVAQKYKPLNETIMTCEDWILFHGYNKNFTETDNKLAIIQLRNRDEDKYNSIWATSYARFISKHSNIAFVGLLQPEEFCNKIGKNDPNHESYNMAFMNISYTKLTCPEWIKVAGYSDDVDENKQKAEKLDPRYVVFMNYYAKSYTEFMQKTENILCGFTMPSDFCQLKFSSTDQLLPFEKSTYHLYNKNIL